eukprot:CAMPEP_0201869730 /NCGR_PEP_ID=MMETSP0902-20130614/3136_1 /ASSEMBLY_ACC=CAM_ASM_000551 /TAXON_ID=420261 /ORGANISM="Thalassiosira antarctica, Strain CCMP982" /LENGTH=476 /DNA_ID=CAMNT_0048395277 /DNA_START=26 /DNA_END=1456 /DNA_ORIENTATION=-
MSNNNTLTLYLSLTSSPSTPRITLTLENNNDTTSTTAAELLRKASDATSVPLASMKLIFRGRVIPDKSKGDVVKEFKLENESVVHVMGKPVNNLVGGGGVAGAASVSAASGSVTAAGASVTLPTGANNTAAGNNASSPGMTALTKMRSSNDGSTYRTALTTADKLLGNIVSHPMEEKYRTIKKSNPAFTKRLGGVNGGSDLMSAAGFTVEAKEGEEYYVLMPNADAWPRLVKAREEVQRVLGESDRSGASAQTAFVPPAAVGVGATGSTLPRGMANLFPGGMPGGGMGGGPGDMAMMQSMMSDPSAMQNVMSMMNNPMVQNMMRNDPRMANNPMLQQSLNALQSNPEMISQLTQMMSDPNVRDRMSNLMSQQQQQPSGAGGGADPFNNGPDAMRRRMEQFQQMSQQFGGSSGGFNAGGGGSGTAAAAGQSGTSGVGSAGANSTNNASGVGGNAGNDSEMTEEEMIAEAIARSLRES